MKTFKFFALVGLYLLLFFQPTIASHLDQTRPEEIPNYVVIGAFSKEANAIRFTNRATKELRLDAKFEMNVSRNLYYVYVLNTQDLSAAIQEARRLRAESEFRDTWVYRGSFSGDSDPALNQNINPMIPLKSEEVPPAAISEEGNVEAVTETPTVITTETPQETPADRNVESSIEEEAKAPIVEAASDSSSEATILSSNAVIESEVDDGKEGTKFLFKISREADLKRIRGDVDVIDVDRSRKMGTYKGNLSVKIASPQNKSGRMSLVCEVFGYRKIERVINYNDPETGVDIIRDASGAVVVPFELTRLKKGDIAVMYNVYFFKDAAVMRPESRYEVNSLVEMLDENPKYKIRIHGHTNGGAAGKIIYMDKDSQNFFSLTDTKEKMGSAKQLSEDRAIIIRNYLIDNGIEPKRMEIKAWGGKRPIHDKMSNRAQENVRVEVEILED